MGLSKQGYKYLNRCYKYSYRTYNLTKSRDPSSTPPS